MTRSKVPWSRRLTYRRQELIAARGETADPREQTRISSANGYYYSGQHPDTRYSLRDNTRATDHPAQVPTVCNVAANNHDHDAHGETMGGDHGVGLLSPSGSPPPSTRSWRTHPDENLDQDEVDMAVTRMCVTGPSASLSPKGVPLAWTPQNLGAGEQPPKQTTQQQLQLEKQLVSDPCSDAHLPKYPSKDDICHTHTTHKYTLRDVFFNLVSMLSYLFDVGSDVFLVYVYYTNSQWWWFTMTLSFILIPSVVMTCFSLKWYIADHRVSKAQGKDGASTWRWVSRGTFLFLQAAPLLR